jgi:hypothetical protein
MTSQIATKSNKFLELASFTGPTAFVAGCATMVCAPDSPKQVVTGGVCLGAMAIGFLLYKANPKMMDTVLDKVGIKSILLPAAAAGIAGNVVLAGVPLYQMIQENIAQLSQNPEQMNQLVEKTLKDPRLLLIVSNGYLWLRGNVDNFNIGFAQQVGRTDSINSLSPQKKATYAMLASIALGAFGFVINDNATKITAGCFLTESSQRLLEGLKTYFNENPEALKRMNSIKDRLLLRDRSKNTIEF